jgi:DNA-binding YbaB/EbfC family protein
VSGSGFDLGRLLEQARDLQGKLDRLKQELRHRTVSATVGGGMVEATVNGHLELVAVRIDPQAVDPRDVAMLQDLIVAAVNQASERARELAQREMQQATGLPLSALEGLFGGGRGER